MGEHHWLDTYTFNCPLCGHGLEIAPKDEEMCQFCGAQLDIFDDHEDADQFANTQKSFGESARITKVLNGDAWVVGHKATPSAMSA
ncbi:MAG: hypothetical protein ACYDBB_25745 [Armatimonadota bacterium]